jgi:hypothetical protein
MAVAALAYAGDWGHVGWRAMAFTVDTPPIRNRGSETILLAETGSAWMIPSFAPEISFMAIEPNFPASAAYFEELRSRLARRSGEVHLVVPVHTDIYRERAQRANRAIEWVGLSHSQAWCDLADRSLARARLHLMAQWQAGDANGPASCVIAETAEVAEWVRVENEANLGRTSARIAGFGYVFDAANCESRMASIGAGSFPYQWCRLIKP